MPVLHHAHVNPTSTMSDDPRRHRNLRTALILLSVVVAFFVGVIVNRWLIHGG